MPRPIHQPLQSADFATRHPPSCTSALSPDYPQTKKDSSANSFTSTATDAEPTEKAQRQKEEMLRYASHTSRDVFLQTEGVVPVALSHDDGTQYSEVTHGRHHDAVLFTHHRGLGHVVASLVDSKENKNMHTRGSSLQEKHTIFSSFFC